MSVVVTPSPKSNSGFTLVEISIVLVIIGLLVGGVLVGRDLIRASELRRLVSEVDELRSAVNTFRLKYGQLPGDMHVSLTQQLGFFTFTGPYAGAGTGTSAGNNNGVIESYWATNPCHWEGSILFRHLAEANLIKLSSSTLLKTDTNPLDAGTPVGEISTTPYSFSKYLYESKIGGVFFCATALSHLLGSIPANTNRGQNAFNLRPSANAAWQSDMESSMTPIDLYNVDKKMDDGTPFSGKAFLDIVLRYSPPVPFNVTATPVQTCSYGPTIATAIYNVDPATGGNIVSCQPVFVW